ncbi:hypothetical protein BJ165DRAFT_1103971 [Panaeolus papilionaceus]|nr:hypothetical protein BJ165DRAFT_1103971 [Panaeolus papilionaceus]
MPPHRLLDVFFILPILIHGLIMGIPSIQPQTSTKSLDTSSHPSHGSHIINSNPGAEEQTPGLSIDINQGLDATTANIIAALKASEPRVPFEYHHIDV